MLFLCSHLLSTPSQSIVRQSAALRSVMHVTSQGIKRDRKTSSHRQSSGSGSTRNCPPFRLRTGCRLPGWGGRRSLIFWNVTTMRSCNCRWPCRPKHALRVTEGLKRRENVARRAGPVSQYSFVMDTGSAREILEDGLSLARGSATSARAEERLAVARQMVFTAIEAYWHALQVGWTERWAISRLPEGY